MAAARWAGGLRGRRRLLAGVSLAQLAAGLAGMALAIRRRHPADTPVLTRPPKTVAADSVLFGTAMSAPVTMLATQAVLTGVVATRESDAAVRGLRVLGIAMVGGYLAERHVRHRLTPQGWDHVETPVLAGGLKLAAAMAIIGRGAGSS